MIGGRVIELDINGKFVTWLRSESGEKYNIVNTGTNTTSNVNHIHYASNSVSQASCECKPIKNNFPTAESILFLVLFIISQLVRLVFFCT